MLMEQINKKRLNIDKENITLQIPLFQNFEKTSNSEEIERNFIDKEIKKIIGLNEDNEKYQIAPFLNTIINKVTFNINLSNGITNSNNLLNQIGFVYEDVYYLRKVFTESFLLIEVMNSNEVISTMKIKLNLDVSDFVLINGSKQLKPFNEIKTKIITYNPKKETTYNNNGFFMYLSKKQIGTKENPKYLYLKCSFLNVKTGITHRLGSKSGTSSLDEIATGQYIPVKVYNDNGLFYYEFDTTDRINISSSSGSVTVNLYEIMSS